jgi:hypothetical protein
LPPSPVPHRETTKERGRNRKEKRREEKAFNIGQPPSYNYPVFND